LVLFFLHLTCKSFQSHFHLIFVFFQRFYYDVLLVDATADVWLCIFRGDNPFLNTARRVTTYFFALFGLIVPLIVIGILYGLIINILRKNAKGKQVAKGKKRVTKMVSAVISSFVICWTPMQVYLVYLLYKHHSQVPILIAIVSQSLVYISSCVNPILYAFLSEPFRKAFKQFLTCSKFLSNSNDITISGKTSTHRAAQGKQEKKAVRLTINMNNNNHRMKIETNSTTLTSEPVTYNRLSNTNLTNI
jgi:hypothetical protein